MRHPRRSWKREDAVDASVWSAEDLAEYFHGFDLALLREAAERLNHAHDYPAGDALDVLADVIESFDWNRYTAEHLEWLATVEEAESQEVWLGTIVGHSRVEFDIERFPEPPPGEPEENWGSLVGDPEEWFGGGGRIPYDEYEDEL